MSEKFLLFLFVVVVSPFLFAAFLVLGEMAPNYTMTIMTLLVMFVIIAFFALHHFFNTEPQTRQISEKQWQQTSHPA